MFFGLYQSRDWLEQKCSVQTLDNRTGRLRLLGKISLKTHDPQDFDPRTNVLSVVVQLLQLCLSTKQSGNSQIILTNQFIYLN